MAVSARHRVFLRMSGPMGCVLKVSAKSQFLKRFKRSEAVERLEHLERASVCVRATFSPRKNEL